MKCVKCLGVARWLPCSNDGVREFAIELRPEATQKTIDREREIRSQARVDLPLCDNCYEG